MCVVKRELYTENVAQEKILITREREREREREWEIKVLRHCTICFSRLYLFIIRWLFVIDEPNVQGWGMLFTIAKKNYLDLNVKEKGICIFSFLLFFISTSITR